MGVLCHFISEQGKGHSASQHPPARSEERHAMRDYRCYHIDAAGHIIGVEAFEVPGDS